MKVQIFPDAPILYNFLWAKLKWLSSGLPNRMLRVQIPSLTPIFTFYLRLCSSDGMKERKFPKLEVARSSRVKAFQIFRRVVSIGKTSVSKTKVLRSNRSVPASFQHRAKASSLLPHLSHFSRGRYAKQVMAVVLKTIAQQVACGFESCTFRQSNSGF